MEGMMFQKVNQMQCLKNSKISLRHVFVLFISLVLVCALMTGSVSAEINNQVQITQCSCSTTINTYENLSLAVAAVPNGGSATIQLLGDMEFNSSIVIGTAYDGSSSNERKTITIDGMNYTISRGKNSTSSNYDGNFITLNYGSNLTIKNVTIDAEGRWEFNWTAINYYLDNPNVNYTEAQYPTRPLNGNIFSNETLIINKGEMVIEDAVIKNFHTHEGRVSLIDLGCTNTGHTHNYANLTIRNTEITGVATSTNTAAIVDMYQSYTNLILEGNTRIHHNFANGNGGLVKADLQSSIRMKENVIISNNIASNSNGIIFMVDSNAQNQYASKLIMDGGKIQDNIGIRGATNGRNAVIYVYNYAEMHMNGGEITNNTGGRDSGIDVRECGRLYLKGGVIDENRAVGTIHGDIAINGGEVIIVEGADVKVDGTILAGTHKIINKGILSGDISLVYYNNDRPDYWEVEGGGSISGNIKTNLVPSSNQNMVNFNYDGGIDSDKFSNYQKLLSLDSYENVQPLRSVTKSGYVLSGWKDDNGNIVSFPITADTIVFINNVTTYTAIWTLPQTPEPEDDEPQGTSIWLTETPTPTPTENETPMPSETPTTSPTLAPTDIPTILPNDDKDDGIGMWLTGEKLFNGTFCIFGSILVLLLLFFFLLLFLFRHRVTFIMMVNGETQKYRIRVWHGKHIKQDKLPELLQNAVWYLDEEKTKRWDFEEDKVKKSFNLYLG